MIKTKVLLQTENGCKYLVNPDEGEYVDHVHLVDPDLSQFRNNSPEELSIVNGKIMAAHGHCVTKSDKMPYQQVVDTLRSLQGSLEELRSVKPVPAEIPPPSAPIMCTCSVQLPRHILILSIINFILGLSACFGLFHK